MNKIILMAIALLFTQMACLNAMSVEGTQVKPVEINIQVKNNDWQGTENNKLTLVEAVKAGDVIQVMNLLNSGVKANVMDFQSGETPLMLASEKGFADIAQLLIEKGKADVNKVMAGGATALMLAAYNGHIKVVELLLKKGANKNARTFNGGQTAASLAQKKGNNEIVNLLNKK